MDFLTSTQKKIEKSSKSLMKTISLKSYRKLAVNFLILTVNLIIIVLYFTLSQATVVIVPAKENFSHTMVISIAENGASAENESISVAGKIASVEVTREQTISINETSEILAIARGTITIFNATPSRNQIFVKDTRFAGESGMVIKIEQRVQLAPGESITIGAYAAEEGKKGEVNSGRFQVIALPYLKDNIYAEIAEPFTGGIINVKTVTTSLFNEARTAIEQSLKDTAWEKLSLEYENLPARGELRLELTEFDASANPGDSNIDAFTVTATGTASVFIYNNSRAKEIVKQELVKNIPPDKILVNFIKESYLAEPDPATSSITVSISAKVQPKLSETILVKEDIVGMNQDEVLEHFQKITGIRNVEVKFWPFWVRSVPNLIDHVDIEIRK